MFIRSTLLNLSSSCVYVSFCNRHYCHVFDRMKEASLVMLLWFLSIIMQVACQRESSLQHVNRVSEKEVSCGHG
jgi:hypothetical protein